jgi:DNA-binding winged helix-turn-helix (wHTH) protein/tetratricopeptide (TPR) repeat protein
LQQVAFATGQVDLARVRAFALGPLKVTPATRQVALGLRRETLEPRVMQVLVALAEAQGDVVTRDTLIERCWDGVVVGDGAINRVICRLRQVGAAMDGAFRIETITKVGYRLGVAGEADAPGSDPWPGDAPIDRPLAVADGPAAVTGWAAAPPDPAGAGRPAPGAAAPRVSRRALVAAGVALAVGAGAAGHALIGRASDRRQRRAQAQDLLTRARGVRQQQDWWANQQAIALLRRAVAVDPQFAEAWGELALTHSDEFAGSPPIGLEAIHARVREAAARALALDPDNRDAQAALALVPHHFRHWAPVEAQLRAALARDPEHRTLNVRWGSFLDDSGRWREALAVHRQSVGRDPIELVARQQLARALWATGATDAAAEVLSEALRLWPASDTAWLARFSMLALSGNPAGAMAMGTEPATYAGRNGDWQALLVTGARALRDGGAKARAGAVAAHLAARREKRFVSYWGALWLAALGEPETALDLLEAYLLGPPFDPARSGTPHPLVARTTSPLFLPPMRPLFGHPRHAALLEAVGLEDYWARTGKVPDFRRIRVAAR